MNNSDDILFTKLQINSKKKDKKIIEIFKDKKTNNIIIKLDDKDKNTKFGICISAWENTNFYINNMIIDLPQKVNNSIKGYETFNVVSETGDSIYSPLLKELPIEEKGQVFISEDKIEEIVQAKLDKMQGALKQEK